MSANNEIFGTVTDVYWWNRASNKFFKVNQGGTSSSKTVSIMQNICEDLMKDRLTALVTGAQHHTLESGPKNDLKDIIALSPVLRAALKNPDAEGNKILFNNGSRITFKAYDKPGKAKSGKRDITFINEANEISYQIAQHLYKRTRKTVYIDYNSDARFWVHDYIVQDQASRTDYFISNFTHNPYIPKETLLTLKAIYKKWKSTGSDYWENEWNVYGLGLTGSVAGTIFGHNYFRIDDFDSVLGLQKRAYAIDFGYTNDPTAILDCGFKFGNVYGKQKLYETGQYGSKLARLMKDQLKLDRSRPVICDNDKASIMALRDAGFHPLVAKKPLVEQRVSLMQDYDIFVDRESHDWHWEQQHYKFKLNPLTLEYTNTPVDKNNHCFDAYGYYLLWATGYSGGRREKSGRKMKCR